MEMRLLSLLVAFVSLFAYSSPSIIGIHPLDEKYFSSEIIKCKDGSNSFTRDRINDDFCDCPDGTDEPGTSACPSGKFYCKNMGSTPKFLFSSRVNDRICDCCDGSDEYDGSIVCPNTCVMGGTVEYKTINYGSTIRKPTSKGRRTDLNTDDSIHKLQGLKLVMVVQFIFVIVLVAFRLFYRRLRSRRRR